MTLPPEPLSGGGPERGFISTEHTYWCGTCVFWEQESSNTKAEAERFARQRGWHKTKQHGWVCPRCWKALQETHVVIYIEPKTGKDANDGRTAEAAVKTMRRAQELVATWLERHPEAVSSNEPAAVIHCESNLQLYRAGLPMKKCP